MRDMHWRRAVRAGPHSANMPFRNTGFSSRGEPRSELTDSSRPPNITAAFTTNIYMLCEILPTSTTSYIYGTNITKQLPTYNDISLKPAQDGAGGRHFINEHTYRHDPYRAAGSTADMDIGGMGGPGAGHPVRQVRSIDDASSGVPGTDDRCISGRAQRCPDTTHCTDGHGMDRYGNESTYPVRLCDNSSGDVSAVVSPPLRGLHRGVAGSSGEGTGRPSAYVHEGTTQEGSRSSAGGSTALCLAHMDDSVAVQRRVIARKAMRDVESAASGDRLSGGHESYADRPVAPGPSSCNPTSHTGSSGLLDVVGGSSTRL
eukprot:PhM_4_TR11687/c3_g1_i8/m.76292